VVGVKKCVVILSGGPDSVTAAYWAREKGYEVHALTFNYDQKAKIEIEYAAGIADIMGITQRVIDVKNLNIIYEGVTSLVDANIEVTSSFTAPIIVPFRNGIFLSIAIAYADGIGAELVLYGAHASDEENYPDCRREFYEAFQTAARLGTDKEIMISSPLSHLSKAEVLREAVRLGAPLEKTWSCYLQGPIHCGSCESCNNRRNAFVSAGIPDPTKYES
jgi:7-cyano-7-deazaguanine synthase